MNYLEDRSTLPLIFGKNCMKPGFSMILTLD